MLGKCSTKILKKMFSNDEEKMSLNMLAKDDGKVVEDTEKMVIK